MQFSVKTILAVAISMATLASAAPQAPVDAATITDAATVTDAATITDAAAAESSVTATEINENDPTTTIVEVIPAPSNPDLHFRCCAFQGCKVCADYGTIDSCSPCGGAYPWCCAL